MSLQDYEIIRSLGVGAFGVVKLAKEKKSGRLTALKETFKYMNTSQILSEREILVKAREAHSPWIVQLYAAFQQGNSLFLSMEFMECGDLMNHLMKYHVFTESQAKGVFRSLVSAIDHLHSRLQYVHCDIKPDHVMFSGSAVKLVDFGLSRPIADAPFFGLVGTPDYMAPEIYGDERSGWGPEVDFWSLGCVLFEMLFGGPPFSDVTHEPEITKQRVLDHQNTLVIPVHDRPVSFACRSMLENLLCDRKNRLNLTLLKLHAFLQDFSGVAAEAVGNFLPKLTQPPENAEHFEHLLPPPNLGQTPDLQSGAETGIAVSGEFVANFDWSEEALQEQMSRKSSPSKRHRLGGSLGFGSIHEDDEGCGQDFDLPKPSTPAVVEKENSFFLTGSMRTEKSRFARPGSFQYNPVQTKPLSLFGRPLSVALWGKKTNLAAPVQPMVRQDDRYAWH